VVLANPELDGERHCRTRECRAAQHAQRKEASHAHPKPRRWSRELDQSGVTGSRFPSRGFSRRSGVILKRFGTAVAPALCVPLIVTGSASAATMVLQGRFACNDGGSLAGVRVELLQIYTRHLPEIPPNVRVAVATHADGNGGWGFRVSGSESNWRVRAVLVNSDVGVKDFPIPGTITPTR
jgi:hypothetical protein